MNQRFSITSALALLALAAPTALMAQKAPRSSAYIDALTKCRVEADPARRVACYDGAVDALSSAREKKEIVVLDREDVRETRRGLFGFSLPKLPFFGGRDDDPGVEVPKELVSTVKSAREIGYGKWRIVIEDGAVWETTTTSSGFRTPKPGQPITITRGAITNYFLKVDRGRTVSAKRVG